MALILVGVATAIGAIVRTLPYGGRAFPLNDGGLVFELVRTLTSHGFAVPFDVGYNGLELPFAYPPVSLFLIGGYAALAQVPIPYAETFVAVTASILCIPMVYFLARQFLDTRQAAAGAAFVFALAPNSFQWAITGGGAARGIALFLTLLALEQGLRAMRGGGWVNAANAGLLTGLTTLTAQRPGSLLILSLIVVALFRARRLRTLRLAAVWVAAAAITDLIWFNVVVGRHGVETVVAAVVAGLDPTTSLKTLLSFELSGAPILDVISILGVVGIALLVIERRFLLPIWFVLVFAVDQRAGITYAMVPLSMIVSHAATEVVLRWPDVFHLRETHARIDRAITGLLAAAVLMAAILGASTVPVVADSPLRSVTDDQFAAMIWARHHLNPQSRFVVLSAARWETDAFGSWFPAVADMQNLAAVQGYEWLGLPAFQTQQARHDQVQSCASHTIDCVTNWLHVQNLEADYVLIPKVPTPRPDCCAAARESLRTTSGFQVIYDGPGATIASIPGGAATDDPVIIAAGDIAACDSAGAASTASLVARMPGTVLTLGDNAYETGSAQQFADCYDPTWGRFKDRTMPTPGNHDYYTPGATGYYSYFGAAAGNPSEGWYSFDVGTWHVVVLNSDCDAIGGCGTASPQLTWLTADLQAHPAACTLAVWHHPLFTGGSEGPATATRAFWRVLYQANADLILNGHEHSYQRFAPQTPDGQPDANRGIREIVVGTGGRNLLPFKAVAPNTVIRDNTTYGVLRLTLHPDSYDWQFVSVVAGGFTDSGSGTCH